MQALFSALARALAQGRGAVLCGILARSGSTPRGPGALMAVFPGGETAGTIGGGALEGAVRADALALPPEGGCRLRTYRLAPSGALGGLDMACGGEAAVCLLPLGGAALPLVQAAEEALAHPLRDLWLAAAVEEGGPCRLGLWGGPPALQALEGVPPEAVEPLLTGESQYRPGAPGLWVLPLARAGRTYLFGGGHVGAELCPLLARTGFRPVVCDDRPGFARRERFPQAEEVLLVDYRDLSPLPLTERDRAVVLTAGHQGDFEVLRQVLAAPVCYVGCIGSRRKAALLRERLAALGFSPARLDQIWSPIGLPIGGDTPAEIAVSIAAQLIAHRAGRLPPPGAGGPWGLEAGAH